MPIASPCKKICTMDPASNLCLGCGRTLAEIAGWAAMTDAERQRIMKALPDRLAAHRLNPLPAPEES